MLATAQLPSEPKAATIILYERSMRLAKPVMRKKVATNGYVIFLRFNLRLSYCLRPHFVKTLYVIATDFDFVSMHHDESNILQGNSTVTFWASDFSV